MKRLFSWRHAILSSGLQPTTRHVLLTLACHMSDAGESCFPSIDTLAQETGLSRKSVIDHLRHAREAGWIKVSLHGLGGQKWKAHEYTVAVPEGGEVDTPPLPEGGEARLPASATKVVNLTPEGGEPNGKKVVNDVHPNSSVLTLQRTLQSGKYTPAFEAVWADYPIRDGGNSKQAAFKAWTARIRSGADPGAMHAGVQRYAAHMTAKGKAGTEFVMQASTFFGPSEHWLQPWSVAVRMRATGDVGVASTEDWM